MREYPLVSIVTLTYKKFDYIYDTIGSVLVQNYPNIEYIIADDGSDNFPKEEIEKFVSEHSKSNLKKFTILHDEKNVGTVKNINRAYAYAQGEYLMPLSGDDEFFNNSVVSRIVREFIKRDCDALTAMRVVCNEDLKPLYYLPHISDKKILKKYDTAKKQYRAHITDRFCECSSGSVLYLRKKKWEELGKFDEQYILLEDAPFFAKYLWENNLEILYNVRAIYYRLGGVSNGMRNPLMVADSNRYNQIERKKHFESLNTVDRMIIKYICDFNGEISLMSRIKVYLKNPVVFCMRFVKVIHEKYKIRMEK